MLGTTLFDLKGRKSEAATQGKQTVLQQKLGTISVVKFLLVGSPDKML